MQTKGAHTYKKDLNLGIAQKGGGFQACPNCLEHFFIEVEIFLIFSKEVYYRDIVCDFPAIH